MKDTLLNFGSSAAELSQSAESSIDLFLESEALAEVPFVEYAFSIKNAKDKYQIAKVTRNYANFVKSASQLNDVEAIHFTNEIFADSEKAEEASETIFDIITEAERPLKAEVLGNLCVHFAKKNISLDEFNTLTQLMRFASLPALRAVKLFLESNQNLPYHNSLMRNEYEAQLQSIGVAIRNGNAFRLDTFGMMLAYYGFNIPVEGVNRAMEFRNKVSQ
jgi:hypothetical protein